MEVLVLSVLAVLALVNGGKALERVRGTLQIAVIYHQARETNPASLGPDLKEAEKKVQGFLQETISSAMLHSFNTTACIVLGWFLWKGSPPPDGFLKGVLFTVGIMATVGGFGAAGWLVAEWLRNQRAIRALEKLKKTLQSDTNIPRMKLWDLFVIVLWIAAYVLTGIAALALLVVLYKGIAIRLSHDSLVGLFAGSATSQVASFTVLFDKEGVVQHITTTQTEATGGPGASWGTDEGEPEA